MKSNDTIIHGDGGTKVIGDGGGGCIEGGSGLIREAWFGVD